MATQLEDDFTDEAESGDEDSAEVEQDNDARDDGEHPEDDHDVVTFGGSQVDNADEPEGMRNLRNRLKELERENKTLKAPAKQEELGARPTLEEFDYDEDAHADAVAAWVDRKRQIDADKGQREQLAERQRTRWEEQVRDLDTGYGDLRVPGKDAARATVEDAFPGEQFAYLVKAAGKNAPAFVLALGSAPDKRSELAEHAKHGDWAEFIAAAAVMAKEVSVERRRPRTEPEANRSAVGRSSGGSGAAKLTLERLEREAERTNDRTELIAYRRKLREQGR